jgi:hypothetical protein
MATSSTGTVLAGFGSFSLNGTFYDVMGSLEYTVSNGFMQETIKGMSGSWVKKTIEPAACKVSLMDNGGLYVGSLTNLIGANIVFFLANGKTISVASAWTVGNPTVNASEGSFEIALNSMSLTEVLAS